MQCKTCSGKGLVKCNKCYGEGFDYKNQKCDACLGEGVQACTTCQGSGKVSFFSKFKKTS